MAYRLFVGVPLPPSARQDLAGFLRQAFPHGMPGRPVPSENWHLTLRFLGDVDGDGAARLRGELSVTELGKPFGIRFGSVSAFPSPARARVLWLGLGEGVRPLRELAGAVEGAARRAGFDPESRPFSPHLTLARFRTPADLRETLPLLATPGPAVEVVEAVLFRSRLGGPAPRYEIVHRFPL